MAHHAYGKDETLFWGGFDYVKSVKAGMEDAGLASSGEFGFVEPQGRAAPPDPPPGRSAAFLTGPGRGGAENLILLQGG